MADFDPRELINDPGQTLRAALKGALVETWTALPGLITKFDPVKMTCEVQPAIKATVLDARGVSSWVQLPLLVDCPVVFPSAGGFSLTFPIKEGDEALVIFSARCIDSWWQSGGVQVQAELRLHDLSDGFVIPGPRSQPRVLPGIDTEQVQLRSDDGTTSVSINAAGEINVIAPTMVTVTAPEIVLNGNVTINGTLDVTGIIIGADFKPTAEAFGYLEHKHNILHGSDLGPPVVFVP